MNTIIDLFQNLRNTLGCIGELLGYVLRFVSAFFQTRAFLAARLVAAESQLGICTRRIEQKARPKPRFTSGFRVLWVVLSKFWSPWQAAAQLMQPATVKARHTRAFKIYWRWKSRRKPGRPPITQEMRDLIRKLSRDNPLWGPEVIRLTLVKLQYDPPCEDTIRKYMVKPKNPRGKSTTWLPFLRNHMDVSWAIDFFTVNTIRFATLYVFIILDHGRRKVVHLAITPNPSMRWVVQQLREAMPYASSLNISASTTTASMAVALGSSWTPAASRRCGLRTGLLGRIRSSKDSGHPSPRASGPCDRSGPRPPGAAAAGVHRGILPCRPADTIRAWLATRSRRLMLRSQGPPS